MKYLIITYDNYFNIPYVQHYENCMKKMGIDYDIILWNRGGHAGAAPENHLVFTGADSSSKLIRLKAFLSWRRFVLKALKAGNYDRLIVLTTLPGILLHHVLTTKYRKKYWFDVRDYTYEQVPFYKNLVSSLVRHSLVTSISSKAFQDFLPVCDHIVLTHNITNDAQEAAVCSVDPRKRPIVIGFVGGIQYQPQNEILLSQIGNQPEFFLKYIGKIKPGITLPQYCQKNGIENVEFHPVYQNSEKPVIYQSIDLINSLYGSGSKITRLALPNKLYDCILFKKPILVSSGTYLADIVEQYQIGLALDLEKDPIAQKLLDYMDQFDPEVFAENCRRLLQVIRPEIQKFNDTLEQFCSGKRLYEYL